MQYRMSEKYNIDYVGKIIIKANNPKELASWYKNKFGLNINLEVSGEFHTTVINNNNRLYIEIIPSVEKLKNIGNIQLHFCIFPNICKRIVLNMFIFTDLCT